MSDFIPGKVDISDAAITERGGPSGGSGGGSVISSGQKPALDQIISIIKAETTKWDSIHAKMKTWESWLYDGVGGGMVPEGYDAFKQPLMYIVRGGAAVLITDTPEFAITASKRGEAGEDQAEKLKLYAELQLKWGNKQCRADMAKELAKTGLWAGLMVLRGPIYDAKAWGEEPERKDFNSQEEFDGALDSHQAMKESNHPFRYDVTHPTAACPFDDGVGIVIEYERSVADIKAAFPDWNDEGAGRNDTKTWREYYDGHWRCFMVGWEPVLQTGDGIVPCVRVPYQWAFSTFGTNTRGATPAQKCIGILSGLDYVLTQQNNFLTAFFADISNRAYHLWKAVKGQYKKIGKGPGAIVEVSKPEDFQAMDQGHTPPDFVTAMSFLNKMLELNTFNLELLGLGVAQTATQTGMRLSQARLPFAPFLKSVENTIVEAIVKSAYEFRDNPDLPSIPLGPDKTIKQDDIVRPVYIELDLQPVDTELNDRLLDAGIKLNGTLSEYTVVKDFLQKDPDEEVRHKLEYSVYYDPETQTYIKQQALMLASARLELNKARELVSMAQAGQLAPVEVSDTMEEGQPGGQTGGMAPQGSMPGVRPDQFAQQRAQGRNPMMPGTFGASSEQGPEDLTRGGV